MTLMDNPTWTLVDRLRKSRLLAGLEQAQIADALGVARNTVSNWERGRSEPSATYFVRWAHATGVTLDWLAEGVNAETAPTEVEAVSSLSQHSVRPKGLEPLTF
ncbi:helix-turn-helix domain-containing protein [Microbacterium sp. TPU 3598]|uniref:helix-turn-helix domain-containing protein n=1 Tax=Microbacterium sp. TPU 3598 TaxID=1938334 RepID=UPI000BBAF2F8|nr:helix-turn-helix transcriptional regulator [Microbacterium sp. TPU 3598]